MITVEAGFSATVKKKTKKTKPTNLGEKFAIHFKVDQSTPSRDALHHAVLLQLKKYNENYTFQLVQCENLPIYMF